MGTICLTFLGTIFKVFLKTLQRRGAKTIAPLKYSPFCCQVGLPRQAFPDRPNKAYRALFGLRAVRPFWAEPQFAAAKRMLMAPPSLLYGA